MRFKIQEKKRDTWWYQYMNTTKPLDNTTDGWIEYRKLVIQSLDDLKINQKEIRDTQVQILLDVRGLKVKATIYGGLSGFVISVLVGLAVAFLL